MGQFNPTIAELSAIEQVEAAYNDPFLDDDERQARIAELWRVLERAHGGRVLSIISPEGAVIERPFYIENK